GSDKDTRKLPSRGAESGPRLRSGMRGRGKKGEQTHTDRGATIHFESFAGPTNEDYLSGYLQLPGVGGAGRYRSDAGRREGEAHRGADGCWGVCRTRVGRGGSRPAKGARGCADDATGRH